MEEPKKNKAVRPEETKGLDGAKAPEGVRIRFRTGRAAEGVQIDENGEAVVDAELANYLISIGYADAITKKEN